MTDPIRSSTSGNLRLPDLDPPAPPPPPKTVGDLGTSIAQMKEIHPPPATFAADVLRRFVAAQTTPVPAYAATAKTATVQAKLNDFMKAATPTYRLPDGSTVSVPAFFRMGGENAWESKAVAANRAPRDAIAAKLGATAPFDSGRVSLTSIHTVTQGLIDAGRLPKEGDAAENVRQMAWDHGVGIDCAGYVQKALFASHGGAAAQYGLKDIQHENLMDLAANPKWRGVAVTDARPGDVLTLAKNDRDVGHTMIVYENVLASPAQRDALRAQMKSAGPLDPKIDAVLRDPKLHVYQLDSSWGTGDKVRDGGGVQRRTWLYGEASGWVCDNHDRAYVAPTATPLGHPVGGVFRPKGEP